MEKIGITEVRQILLDVLAGYTYPCKMIECTPDDKFLKVNLRYELNMDSLDIEEMLYALDRMYGIDISDTREYAFPDEPTVANFIEMVNDHVAMYKRYGK